MSYMMLLSNLGKIVHKKNPLLLVLYSTPGVQHSNVVYYPIVLTFKDSVTRFLTWSKSCEIVPSSFNKLNSRIFTLKSREIVPSSFNELNSSIFNLKSRKKVHSSFNELKSSIFTLRNCRAYKSLVKHNLQVWWTIFTL